MMRTYEMKLQYVTGSEKTAHFAQVTRFLSLVYWIRLTYKLHI